MIYKYLFMIEGLTDASSNAKTDAFYNVSRYLMKKSLILILPARGGGARAQWPILHFFMENSPHFAMNLINNNRKLTPPQTMGQMLKCLYYNLAF